MILFCGPKLSMCIIVISIWGLAQLGLMGVFFYINSVCLFEDLPLDSLKDAEPKEFLDKIEAIFYESAINCWITAAVYLFSMLVAIYQFTLNRRFQQINVKKNTANLLQN